MSTIRLPILRSFRIINISRWYSSKEAKAPAAPKKPVDSRRVFKIYRFSGVLTNEQPIVQSYDLDVSTCGKMVLDALIKLKDMDPSLTFRRSCREGICGSCGINLQGSNCLACITKIPDAQTITIYPLPHMYVIRDLVVDMTHFFNGYNSIRPYLVRKQAPNGQLAQSLQDNMKMVGLYECVLCACCSTSCPSYWWNGRRFLGPATLLHAYRWCIDSRDEDTAKRLHDLRDDFKAFRCHTIMNCSTVCPKNLHPGGVIAKLKLMISNIQKKPAPELDPMKFSSGSGLGSCVPKACRK
ncbi:Succinate dehydrogenase, iron-sulfur subunit [Operophtera brumata]|uniref:Succinate dehydrogenase [ubiquinone] iron-sulfur subunit, mitochondrial n=1 Tax=Operophtera brumata TaxID=104452 RepID=A0A0L7LNZ8_OPEBR|nr:Succinate dehydrogenase, iron-sulfur subunit [Operophtera brumata]